MTPLRRTVSLFAGVAALAAAFFPPFERLAAELFSAHMVQHLILVLVAAPLLAYGAPPLRALRPRRREAGAQAGSGRFRWLLGPLPVGLLHAVVLWLWHLPGPYAAALQNPALHALEHLGFLVTAFWFWRLVIGGPEGRRTGYLPATVLVLATALQSCALGVILSFAAFPLYSLHAQGAARWGLTPLEDQQLAGAIMWVPAGGVYLATIAVLLLRAFGEVERRMLRKEMLERTAAEASR